MNNDLSESLRSVSMDSRLAGIPAPGMTAKFAANVNQP